MIGSLSLLTGVGFIGYGALLTRNLTQDFASRHAKKIFAVACVCSASFIVESGIVVYSTLQPKQFDANFAALNSLYLSFDLLCLGAVLYLFRSDDNRQEKQASGEDSNGGTEVTRFNTKRADRLGSVLKSDFRSQTFASRQASMRDVALTSVEGAAADSKLFTRMKTGHSLVTSELSSASNGASPMLQSRPRLLERTTTSTTTTTTTTTTTLLSPVAASRAALKATSSKPVQRAFAFPIKPDKERENSASRGVTDIEEEEGAEIDTARDHSPTSKPPTAKDGKTNITPPPPANTKLNTTPPPTKHLKVSPKAATASASASAVAKASEPFRLDSLGLPPPPAQRLAGLPFSTPSASAGLHSPFQPDQASDTAIDSDRSGNRPPEVTTGGAVGAELVVSDLLAPPPMPKVYVPSPMQMGSVARRYLVATPSQRSALATPTYSSTASSTAPLVTGASRSVPPTPLSATTSSTTVISASTSTATADTATAPPASAGPSHSTRATPKPSPSSGGIATLLRSPSMVSRRLPASKS